MPLGWQDAIAKGRARTVWRVERLPHGYTNTTRRLEPNAIEKIYEGPRRWDNARRERACLVRLADTLAVPQIIETDEATPRLLMNAISGRHGQELIEEGLASAVLGLVSAALRDLQAIDPGRVPGLAGAGSVIVHGDFGPQNMLFDAGARSVVAILDWESAHLGDPVEDLAWAEWIIRAHHPQAVDRLDQLFGAIDRTPPWSARHDAMVRQVRDILAYCDASGMEESATVWRQRLSDTESWSA